jgi:hypothetical protein
MVAAATELARYEAFGSTYVRANQFNQNIRLGQAIGGFDMYGGIVSASKTAAFTFAGPRLYFRKGRFSPFGEVFLGAAYRHISTGVAVTDPTTPSLQVANPSSLFPGPNAQVYARLTTTQNAFAMEAGGGGLDYRISKYFSVRRMEVGYVLTQQHQSVGRRCLHIRRAVKDLFY